VTAGDGDYSLYIIRCRDGSLYTGIALDVQKRVREHETGVRGARYLRGRCPLTLEFSSRLGDRSVAQQAEHRIKRLRRERKEALIAGRLSLRDLGVA